jgi:hypothetical protein
MMHHPVKVLLLLAAAFATGWAAMAWLLAFDGDFKASAVIAILCLGATQFLDYRSEQLRHGREAVWERRDLEALREVD